MVVYYCEAVCHAEHFFHYCQCQGHSEGLYSQDMTVSTMSSELLVGVQPDLVL